MKKLTFIILIISIVSLNIYFLLPNKPAESQAGLFNIKSDIKTNYNFYKTITIDNTKVAADLTNFPVLIDFIDGDLATVANGGDVTNSNGYDIIFTDIDGNQLDHEIESYTASDGGITMWVRLPTILGSTDTTIRMYYGNESITASQENITGVWDSNFKGVYHLKEDPSGTAPQTIDSTSNNNDCTSEGSMTSGDLVDGRINKAVDFDGGDDATDCGSTVGDAGTSNFTIEAWIEPNDITTAGPIAATQEPSGQNFQGWNFFKTTDDIQIVARATNSDTNTLNMRTTAPQLSTNTYVLVVWVRTGFQAADQTVYINGSSVSLDTSTDTLTSANWDSTFNMHIGTRGSLDNFNGEIDEFRISHTNRSSDWILTTYNNQSATSTFYTLGSETSNEIGNNLNIKPGGVINIKPGS